MPCQSFAGTRASGRSLLQYAESVAQNTLNYKNNKDLYRKRQKINSLSRLYNGKHIFGTIKRQWGYNHTNLRGLGKVNGEMALIMTVYNIKRAINILGIEQLLAKLKNWKPDYKKASVIAQKTLVLKLFNRSYILAIAQAA